MKKLLILLCSMATVFGISTDEPKGNLAYASSGLMNMGEFDTNPTAASKGDTEKFKAEFAYEMAKTTAKIVSTPTTNVENFKAEFAYAIAQATAKVMPLIPSGQRNEFAYDMAQMTTKIINEQNVDIEKAKAEFTYRIAQLTTEIITNADKSAVDNRSLLRNNADIQQKTTVKVNNTATDQKKIVNPGYIDRETYTGLIDELTHVSDRKSSDNKVNIDGEIRFHYAFNSGPVQWGRDSSGIRVYLGADTAITKNWRIYGMLEGKKNVVNYDNEFKLSRLYAAGKLGESMVKAGSFSYLMAEGNIFDSGFDGVRVDFGEPIKYTLSYGETDYTKETLIATARYNDFDYNLEAGVYHYRQDDSARNQNTIWTIGSNYIFNNFGVGAIYLNSSLKDSRGDSNGYVLSLNYGELKSWRPGTYGLFAKYYNQPQGTYIAHGMNGIGARMQGFKGHGLGMHYTLSENLVAGLEYYDLTDKVSGGKGETWWSQLTHYF